MALHPRLPALTQNIFPVEPSDLSELCNRRLIILYGRKDSGKSRSAWELAQEMVHGGNSVTWANAEQCDSLQSVLRLIQNTGKKFSIDSGIKSYSREEQKTRVTDDDWLLIVDDASSINWFEAIKDLDGILRRNRGFMIITTNSPLLRNIAPQDSILFHRLPALGVESGVYMMLDVLGSSETYRDCEPLVKVLHGNPLAVETASDLLMSMNISASQLSHLFDELTSPLKLESVFVSKLALAFEHGRHSQILESLRVLCFTLSDQESTQARLRAQRLHYNTCQALEVIYSHKGGASYLQILISVMGWAHSIEDAMTSFSKRFASITSIGTIIAHPSWVDGSKSPGWPLLFQWEIPSVFANQDGVGINDLSTVRAHLRDFVVLSAYNYQSFEAATCTQYLENQFPMTGLKVFRLVSAILESSSSWLRSTKPIAPFNDSTIHLESSLTTVRVIAVSNDYVTLFSEGNPITIAEFTKAMRWICQAVRLLPDSPMTYDPLHSLWLSKGACAFDEFHSSVMTFFLDPLEYLDSSQLGEYDCWRNLFKRAVVAQRHQQRTNHRGLRVSFPMLAELAAVTNLTPVTSQVEDEQSMPRMGLIALGFFTALIPIAYNPSSMTIQWHLETQNGSILDVGDLNLTEGSWWQTTEIALLEHCHCILGWRERVNVMLDTEKAEFNLGWTPLKKKETMIHLNEFGAGAELGLGDMLPISFKGNASAVFKIRSTQVQFSFGSGYEMALQSLRNQVAFIYDSATQTAWLVPQLSWVLHLCHVWYQSRSPTNTPSSNPNPVKLHPIPFAIPSTDGSLAAFEALSGHSDLQILRGITLDQVVLHIVHNIRLASGNRRKARGLTVYSHEAMDMVEAFSGGGGGGGGGGSPLRELRLPAPAGRAWLCLMERADTTSFCRDLGPALDPADRDARRPCGCDAVPSHRSLLAAHSACVEFLLRRDGATLDDLCDGFAGVTLGSGGGGGSDGSSSNGSGSGGSGASSKGGGGGQTWVMRHWPFDACRHQHEVDLWTAAGPVLQAFSAPRRPWSGLVKWNKECQGHSASPARTGAFVFGA